MSSDEKKASEQFYVVSIEKIVVDANGEYGVHGYSGVLSHTELAEHGTEKMKYALEEISRNEKVFHPRASFTPADRETVEQYHASLIGQPLEVVTVDIGDDEPTGEGTKH